MFMLNTPTRVLMAPLLVAMSLACAKPTVDDLRRQPAPVLQLEVNLPDAPDRAAQQGIYERAFREEFAGGLDVGAASHPDRIQLLVVVARRFQRNEAEAKRNNTADTVSAMTSPVSLLLHAMGPKDGYETQVERLGYRPGAPTGEVVLMKPGKGGFQKSFKLDGTAVMKRMRPLGENDRRPEIILAEEARAVALETLALLRQQAGWAPPTS